MPFVPLPFRSRPTFTYRAPNEDAVEPGTLVRIPFGRRTVSGLVFRRASGRGPARQLKTISAILSRGPLFSAAELNMFWELSELSLESFPLMAKSAALVRSPLRQGFAGQAPLRQGFAGQAPLRPLGFPLRSPSFAGQVVGQASLARETGTSLEKFSKQANARSFEVEVRWEPLENVLPNAVKDQILILVPETSIAQNVLRLLETRKVPTAFFAQTLPLRERRAVLRRLAAGEPLAVVATHPGVFLPMPALSHILVAEAALPSHRQWDLYPRYDARIAAVVRAQAQGIALTFQSTLPSLDLFRIQAPEQEKSVFRVPVRVIPRSRTDPLIPPPMLAAIRETVEGGGSVFLFHNIVGTERAFVCGTCGHLLRCSECGGMLERARSQLRCQTCGAIHGPVLRFCPRCKSPHLAPRRIGTTSLVEDLRRALPDTPVLQTDRETVPRTRIGKPAASIAGDAGRRIVVGTERAFAVMQGGSFDRVIVLDADRLLDSSAFDAAERMVVIIARLTQLGRQQPLLLATTHPQLSLMRALETNLQTWMDEELADRQLLGYPPWTALVRLERAFPSRARATQTAQTLLQHLRSGHVSIRGGFQIKERPKIRAEVILRGPLSALSTALRKIPGGWATDPILPVSLLLSRGQEKPSSSLP
ncbi:MAG: hypothetical protein Q8R32_03085 [bacterium]|nr:hypothetical protein [bacterium]